MSKVIALATRRKLQPALKRIPDAVEVVFDLGQWSAATTKEGRLVRRHFATPNTKESPPLPTGGLFSSGTGSASWSG